MTHLWISDLLKLDLQSLKNVVILGTIVNIQLAPCFDQPDHQFKRPIIYEVDDGTAVIKVVQFVKDIIEKQKAENLNDLNGVLSEKIQQKCVMRGPFEVGTTVEVKGVPHLFEGNVELKAYRVRQVDDASDEVERMFVVDALRKQLYSAANNDM